MNIESTIKVLITGGASGIGKIMARLFLEKGAEVILWDIDSEKLSQTIQEFIPLGKISGFTVDVSDALQVEKTAKKVIEIHEFIEILINNAGIIVGKYFHEHSWNDIEKTIQVNALSYMQIVHHFLPKMLKNGSGHICNISSSAGFISNPKMSVYVASKWAATGWSDSLRIEMQSLKTGVRVTTVAPYYINTGMFEGVKSRIIPILKPEYVAKRILKGIEKNKIYISVPLSMHFIRFCQAILPIPVFDFVAGKALGIYHTMDHFKGRNKQNS